MAGFFDNLKELVWPECVGWGIGVAGHYLSRGIDATQGWKKPFQRSQDYVALGGVVIPAYAYGKVTSPASKDILRGVVGSDATLVLEGLADKVFGPAEEKFKGIKARARVSARRPGLPPTGEEAVPSTSQAVVAEI